MPTKDYGLWYQVGLAEWQGLDVYPRPETGRLFPFMYPPSAAAMLGMLSPLGPAGMLIALVAVTSASWIACILLSAWLAAGPGGRRHPLVVIVPTLSVIVLIHNIYLLGQPNLMLLALVLGAFACLRLGREVAAGALVATAAAIKAFPILVLGYLVYRRMWKASFATVAVLAAWLLIAPLPFRTPAQAVNDLSVWTRGMLFTYDTHGIAQRPLRSYSYKNQSIMAVMHRLLRDVPADGEAVLSGRSRLAPGAVRPAKGLPPLDPSTDLLSFLKPHQRRPAPMARVRRPAPAMGRGHPGAEPAFRAAWKVNVLSLDFRTVTMITLAAMLALCLFVAAVMPPRARRTRETDALEFALVTLLTVIFSPLSFNYAYVWPMYPTALALHRVLGDPSDPRGAATTSARLGLAGRGALHPRPGDRDAAGGPGVRQPVRPRPAPGPRTGVDAPRRGATLRGRPRSVRPRSHIATCPRFPCGYCRRCHLRATWKVYYYWIVCFPGVRKTRSCSVSFILPRLTGSGVVSGWTTMIFEPYRS